MLLKKKPIILALCILSASLATLTYRLIYPDGGVVPKGGTDELWLTIAAAAGALTTFSGAVSGAAMKWIDYRKGKLDIEKQRLEILKTRTQLEAKE